MTENTELPQDSPKRNLLLRLDQDQSDLLFGISALDGVSLNDVIINALDIYLKARQLHPDFQQQLDAAIQRIDETAR